MTHRTRQSQTLSPSSGRVPLRLDLSKLGYIEDGHWMPLPKWARFFISLGVFMAEMPAASERNWRAVGRRWDCFAHAPPARAALVRVDFVAGAVEATKGLS